MLSLLLLFSASWLLFQPTWFPSAAWKACVVRTLVQLHEALPLSTLFLPSSLSSSSKSLYRTWFLLVCVSISRSVRWYLYYFIWYILSLPFYYSFLYSFTIGYWTFFPRHSANHSFPSTLNERLYWSHPISTPTKNWWKVVEVESNMMEGNR